jgi:type II secretory pathway pseudopilin PulG
MSPRHERPAGDDTADLELKAVSVPSPEEGHVTVAVLKPRTLPRLVALFAAAVILVALTAYSTTWLAYQQANRNTREQIAALNEDLATRRAQRAETDQRNAAAAETLRRYACALARAASTNPDPDIQQMRTDLACDATPPPAPSTSPGAPVTPGPSTSSKPAGRGGGAPTGGRSPVVGMPRPAPPPPRPPQSGPVSSPSPTDDPLIGCAHLPLLGTVCV